MIKTDLFRLWSQTTGDDPEPTSKRGRYLMEAGLMQRGKRKALSSEDVARFVLGMVSADVQVNVADAVERYSGLACVRVQPGSTPCGLESLPFLGALAGALQAPLQITGLVVSSTHLYADLFVALPDGGRAMMTFEGPEDDGHPDRTRKLNLVSPRVLHQLSAQLAAPPAAKTPRLPLTKPLPGEPPRKRGRPRKIPLAADASSSTPARTTNPPVLQDRGVSSKGGRKQANRALRTLPNGTATCVQVQHRSGSAAATGLIQEPRRAEPSP